MSDILNCKDETIKTFETGALRSDSAGKGRFDLCSPFARRRLALRYEAGAVQKGVRNFEKGIPFSRMIESAERHINQYKEGDRSEDHLAAAQWQLDVLMHFEELIHRGILPVSLNDLPDYSQKNAEAAP